MKKDGVLILNKPEGITSQQAVSRVKRLLGADKAGHTGTLDPLATGVLPILLGRATKASEYMLTEDKHYIAKMRLGITSDTEDITGRALSTSSVIPSESEVLSAVQSFVGRIMQTPPMYSALKVGGKKLCDMARRGEEIEREARPVQIYSIKAERLSDVEYSLSVHCSKGTYIRTLCADIGASLGCGGLMSALCRSEAAGFTLDDAYTLEEIEKMDECQRDKLLAPVEEIFKNLRKIILPPFFARLAHSGLEIYLKKISAEEAYADAYIGEKIALFDGDGFFAVGEVRDFDGKIAVKPVRQFRI